jgi:uncharacterized lipoprotein YmbA
MKLGYATWLIAGIVLALAGCGSPPKINFYTLEARPAGAPAAAPSPLSVVVGPVTVPEEVDRPQMVLRTGPNQVEIADLHRWAEPLKTAIPRVLADALSRELGTARVTTSRQSAALAFDYRVALDVRHFDSSFAEGASLDVLWTLRAAKAGEPRIGRSVVRESALAGDAQAVAAAHGRAIEQVAREIAAAIRALDGR